MELFSSYIQVLLGLLKHYPFLFSSAIFSSAHFPSRSTLSLLLLIFSGFWFPLSTPLKDFVTDSARSSMLSWASNFHQVEISFH